MYTIIYEVTSLNETIELLQDAFESLQLSLLKLIIHLKKTNYLTFTQPCSKAADPTILTLELTCMERLTSYKYLDIW